jgi:prolyl oligopeptidase
MVKSNHALWLWGFNISLTPSFSIANAVWMGGVYAVPIAGGGEYGKKWHDAGTK